MKKTIVCVAAIIITCLNLNAAVIKSKDTGGLWREKSTWVGEVVPTKNDDVVITSVVTTGDVSYSTRTLQMANLTINEGGKVIREAARSGRYSLEIFGSLVNNGEIVDYLDYFDIFLHGDLENNGVFKPRLFYLSGENQHISTTKYIECKTFNLNMSDNEAIATSNLLFKNCYLPKNGTKLLNMGAYDLILSADSITHDSYYGKVNSASSIRIPLKFEKTGTVVLDKAIIGCSVSGNLNLESPTFGFIADMVVDGDVTIAEETKMSSYRDLQTLTINGNYTNYGMLNSDTINLSSLNLPPKRMKVFINGNASNYGNSGITKLYMISNGNTLTLSGDYDGDVIFQQSEGSELPGGKILIKDEVNIYGKIEVYTKLEITAGGTLNARNKELTSPVYVNDAKGEVINKGNMTRYHNINSNWSYRKYEDQPGTFVDYDVRDWKDELDGVEISVFNNQTYPGLPGSIKRWWRLVPNGEGEVSEYTIKFYYDEELLNGQNEENLKVYRTTDEGETWDIVSYGEYAILDTEENSISIGVWSKAESMLNEFGDFVISAGDGSVPVESNVIVDLIGREDIRVGAPNPFTVHLYNITDAPTSSMLVAVNITEDMRFMEVQLPYDDGVEIIPIDSMGNPDDDTQVFYIPYLDANEHYSFDVIVYGLPDALKSVNAKQSTISVGQVCGKVADKAKEQAKEYFWTGITDWLEQDLNDEQNAQLNHVLNLEENHRAGSKAKYGKTVTMARDFTKSVVEKIADKNPVSKMIFKVGNTVESVYNLKDRLRRRLFYWFYKETGLIKEEKINGKQIQGKLVQSWDPNEIVGPSGYGEENYLSEIPMINYTILFENKKEATAPAYRVQIIDTLDAIFDPETVEFGNTSHMGDNYNWEMEREGNILTWDIKGIELPPNATPPEGEGFVRFSVKLNDDVSDGDVFQNRATIIFDMNEPITTNTWVNTLDFSAPETEMLKATQIPGDTIVHLNCQVSDGEGSGIATMQYFVSRNGEMFQPIGESIATEVEYAIGADTLSQSFRFYALATDNVGNAEETVSQIVDFESIPLSTKNFAHPAGFSVYPNPVSKRLFVENLSASDSGFELTLLNMDGRKQEVPITRTDNLYEISLDGVLGGMYLLEIEGETGIIEVHKIIKP